MKTGLSKREKYLVIAAAAVVLIYIGIQFGIIPAYNYYQDGLETLDVVSTEKTLMDMKLANEASTRSGYENAVSKFEDITERYPAVMPNEKVDRILTGLCLESGLSPVMLGIDVSTAPAQAEAGGDEEETTEAFRVVTATMNLSGSYDNLKRLINAVERIEYIRFTRVSYTENVENDRAGVSNISVLFEVTMLDAKQ